MEQNYINNQSAYDTSKVNRQKVILILAAVVLITVIFVAVIGYFWWSKNQQNIKNLNENADQKAINNASSGTIPSFSTNPLENKPDINPAEQSNPIDSVKTNPFE